MSADAAAPGIADPLAPRLILCHKQKTSARTRFLRFADTVLVFGPLPAGARLAEAGTAKVLPHPAAHLREAERRLGLAAGSLEAVADFHAEVATASGPVTVLLGEVTAIDPPFAAAAAAGARFAPITDARDLPPVELDLLRRAYELLIG